MIKYIFVLLFIMAYLAFGYEQLGYSETSELYTHFTYMFSHLSITHLALNSLAFISGFRLLEKFINNYALSAIIIFVGVVSSFLSEQELPTVGSSAMIYSMFGGYISFSLLCKLVSIRDKKQFGVFVGLVVAMLSLGFMQPSINEYAHLLGFVFGVVILGLYALHKNNRHRIMSLEA